MGRGLGGLQRRVIRTLAEPNPRGNPRWLIAEITAAVYGSEYTDSQRRGVARAVTTLEARHIVTTGLTARRFRKDGGRRVPVPETDVFLFRRT